jgi:hypothetical protein
LQRNSSTHSLGAVVEHAAAAAQVMQNIALSDEGFCKINKQKTEIKHGDSARSKSKDAASGALALRINSINDLWRRDLS